MKPINSNELINSLQADLREIMLMASQLERYSATELAKEPAPGKWSVAQVLEHMNIYSRYYLDAIEQKLHLNSSEATAEFRPGWLGNYFTRMMQPGNSTKKYRSPKDHTPVADLDAPAVIAEFIEQQERLIMYLRKAKSVNINATRVPISISKWVRLKLGDTFRFLIAHNERHLLQAKKHLEEPVATR